MALSGGHRVEWDNYYVENRSLWLDVNILLLTPLVLGKHFGQAK
jgi:lipopolysaccharide/colanic/teichoic acid biosynthesis glycosyltransferase